MQNKNKRSLPSRVKKKDVQNNNNESLSSKMMKEDRAMKELKLREWRVLMICGPSEEWHDVANVSHSQFSL